MRTSISWLSLIAFTLCIAGCALSPDQQAANIRDHSIGEANKIEAATQSAMSHISAADQAVVTASAVPGNPAATLSSLVTAHAELTSANGDLKPITTHTAAIKSDATAAANVTAVVNTALVKEQKQFFSDRQKRIGLIALGIMVLAGLIFGVIEYLSATTGVSPIVQTIGSGAVNLLGRIFHVFTLAFKAVYHVGTLGIAWVGREFGKAVAAKAAANAASTAVPVSFASPKNPPPPASVFNVSSGAAV